MELKTILDQVNVDSKDNGRNFTVTNRIQAINRLLEHTDYQLLHQGNLCFIYGKKPVKNQSVILISSHIDCVYDHLFCQELENGQVLKGTFDNSLTNACVLYNMIHERLSENVIIAFTGDEEENADGSWWYKVTCHSFLIREPWEKELFAMGRSHGSCSVL